MVVVEIASGLTYPVEIGPLITTELKLLKKVRYSFNWREIARNYPLFKLTIVGEEQILGIMALAYHPGDHRIEIKLLASSKENVGVKKKFDRIVACFLAYACAEALKDYGDLACVSLLPKTALKTHYMVKYGMLDGGRQLFLEGKVLFDWAKKNLGK